MSQDNTDTPATLLPLPLFDVVAKAAETGDCVLDKHDGSAPHRMSSYKFIQEIATDPSLQAEAWKTALTTAGIGAGAVAGYGALVAVTGPLAPFTALAAVIAAPFFGGNRIATVIVCNRTGGTMKTKEVWQDVGVQTAHPVYSAVDPTTGSTTSTQANVIPGLEERIKGLKEAGIGMYRFEKNLDWGIGFYGTGGAISWECSDSSIGGTVAFAWLVPESGDPGYAVTDDVSRYSSLKDFYQKTADQRLKGMNDQAGGSGHGEILMRANFREIPDKKDPHDMVFTILVRPG